MKNNNHLRLSTILKVFMFIGLITPSLRAAESIEARNSRILSNIPLCNSIRKAFSQTNLPQDINDLVLDYSSSFKEIEMPVAVARIKGRKETDYVRVDLINGKPISFDAQDLFNGKREVKGIQIDNRTTPVLFTGIPTRFVLKWEHSPETQTKNFRVSITHPLHEVGKGSRKNYMVLDPQKDKPKNRRIKVVDPLLKLIANSSSY